MPYKPKPTESDMSNENMNLPEHIETMRISENCGFSPELEDWFKSQGIDPANLRGTRVRLRTKKHSLEMLPIEYSFDDMAKGFALRDALGNWLRSQIDFPEDAVFICQLVIASIIQGYEDKDEGSNECRLKACDRTSARWCGCGT
jgi:hypothetical protein